MIILMHVLITSKETENYEIKIIYEKPDNLLSSRHVEKKSVNNQLIWCF